MIKNYVQSSRLFVRRGLAAVALGCIALSAGAAPYNKANQNYFNYSMNGKVANIGPSGMSKAPITDAGGQIGKSGWYVGGGASWNPGKGATMMEHNGNVFFSGTKYPFQAGYKIPAKTVLQGVTGVLGGPLGLVAALTMPTLISYILEDDKFRVKDGHLEVRNNEDDECDGNGFCMQGLSDDGNWYFSFAEVCSTSFAANPPSNNDGWNAGVGYYDKGAAKVVCPFTFMRNGSSLQSQRAHYTRKVADTRNPWKFATLPDIGQYFDKSPPKDGILPGLINDTVEKGGSINVPNPEVKGPTKIVGDPVKTTSQGTGVVNGETVPTTTVKTTQTTMNFNTVNNTINNTTNTTTTTTTVINNVNNQIINNETEVVDKEPEEKDERSECEKNPDTLNCADLDTPEGEIPRGQRNVQFAFDGSFSGAGYCPSDKYMTIAGQSMRVVNWVERCDAITTWLKPIVLALSIFMAFMIVTGASRE